MHDADDSIAGHPVIVFDGHWVLCSANARFILRNDRHGHFRLAAMQGAVILQRCGVDPQAPETLIVIDGGMAFRNSDAVIAIWRRLGWPWRALAISRIVPRRLRDTVYCWVARNRNRLFGRNEQCFVPDSRWSDRCL